MADMKWHTDKLPHNYINHDKESEVIDKIIESEKALNDAVKHLQSRNIPIAAAEDVTTLSKEKVKSFIDNACEKFISSLGFCPDSLKLETRTKYFDAFKELCPYIEEINSILDAYPLTLEYREEGYYFNIEEAKTYATEQATIHITKAIRDGFELYKKLLDAIEECHKWEVENGRIQVSKRGALYFNNDNQPLTMTAWNYLVGSGNREDFTPELFLIRLGILPNKFCSFDILK